MNGTHPLKNNDKITHVTTKLCRNKNKNFIFFTLIVILLSLIVYLSHYSLDSIAQLLLLYLPLLNIASTRFYITATVASPPSSLSWPPPPQPSPSSTPFTASIRPDHSSSSSAVGIFTPDYMLGLRNILLLPEPSQITHPSPSPVNLTVVEEKEKVCRDCGNRAKKECLFERCRTCCKSRGYVCATHVKSTWVPSSHHRTACRSSSSSDKRKKLRIESSDKHNPVTDFLIIPTRTTRQETSFKEGLPGKIEAPAIFRRMRVTAISNKEETEIGYEATVIISGHVFKGFLHYYGVDHNKALPCLSKNL